MNDEGYLWQGAELAALFGLTSDTSPVNGVSIDSRSTAKGDLFIALSGDPGPKFNAGQPAPDARDGHAFIASAIAAGASVIMRHDGKPTDVSSINVQDTLSGLWKLGAAASQRCRGKTLAITGSSGKTTLRAWFETALATQGKVHASTGSLNNHWGVPLSLSRMPRDVDFGVFEVGTNHPGEIAPLSKLVSPDVALLLNVLPAHIGNFSNMKALRQEKLSIATGITDHGVFVLPESLRSELAQYDFLGRNDLITFGDKNADVSARIQETVAGMDMAVDVAGTIVNCQVPFSGRERAESVMALFGVCHALGVSLTEVAEKLRELPLPKGRGNKILVDGIIIIDDSYNANPASMQMGLRQLQGVSDGKGRKIALLGEMLELGELSRSAHLEVGEAAAGIDIVYTFGDGFEDVPFSGSHQHNALVSDLDIDKFAQDLNPGDIVLVKGSNRVFWTAGFVTALQRSLAGLSRSTP